MLAVVLWFNISVTINKYPLDRTDRYDAKKNPLPDIRDVRLSWPPKTVPLFVD